jgi:hypothetical protein
MKGLTWRERKYVNGVLITSEVPKEIQEKIINI